MSTALSVTKVTDSERETILLSFQVKDSTADSNSKEIAKCSRITEPYLPPLNKLSRGRLLLNLPLTSERKTVLFKKIFPLKIRELFWVYKQGIGSISEAVASCPSSSTGTPLGTGKLLN